MGDAACELAEALETLGLSQSHLKRVALGRHSVPVGHIARDRGGATDLTGGASDRRHAERDVDHAAVLAQALCLEVLDPLTRRDAREQIA